MIKGVSRYVLFYTGEKAACKPRKLPPGNVKVLDTSENMYLVEGSESDVRKLAEGMPDWQVTPQNTTKVPDTRPAVRKPASP